MRTIRRIIPDMDLNKDTYYQEKLSKIVLVGEHFKNKRFEECEFTNCNFSGCKFEECKFLNCKFNDSDLSSVSLMRSHLVDVQFIRCKTIGIDWTKAPRISGLSFQECLVNYSNFRLLKLPKMKMVKCEVKESDFIETDLTDGDFRNTNFEKSVFFKTNLTNADFREATNYVIDVKTNILKKTHFSLPEAMSLLYTLDIVLDE
jgi:fluoroquinolone resistance protein